MTSMGGSGAPEVGQKRKRNDMDSGADEGLKSVLCKLREDSGDTSATIDKLNKLSERVLGLDDSAEFEVLFMQAILNLPGDLDLLAYLCGLFNQSKENSNIISSLVAKISEELTSAFQLQSQGDFDRVRKLLKFVGLLLQARVVLVDDVLVLLSKCVSPLRYDNECAKSYKDFLAYTVLSMLPYCAELLLNDGDESAAAFTEIRDALEKHVTLPRTWFQYMSVIDNDKMTMQDDASNDEEKDIMQQKSSIESEDILFMYWRATVDFKSADDWHLSADVGSLSADQFEDAFGANSDSNPAQDLKIDAIDIPLTCSRGFSLPVMLSFSHQGKALSADNASLLERAIAFDLIYDTIVSFQWVKNECIRELMSLPFTFDYVPQVLETFFSLLCALPYPPFSVTYIPALCCEMLKARPQAIPPVFARIIMAFYNNAEIIDIECQDRVVQLLSAHLSSFSYQWPWKVWLNVPDLPEASRQRSFVQHLVDLCRRLSYRASLMQILPVELQVFLGDETKPTIEYDGEMKDKASELTTVMTQPTADVPDWLSKQLETEEERVSLLVKCILDVGKASFSHLVSQLGTHAPVLQELIKNGSSPDVVMQIIIDTIGRVWGHSSQHISVILDKFLNFGLINLKSVTVWTFKQEQMFHLASTWSIFFTCVEKRLLQFQRAKAQVDDEKEGDAQNSSSSTSNVLEQVNGQIENMFAFIFKSFQEAMIDHSNVRHLIEPRFLQFARYFLPHYFNILSTLRTGQVETSMNDDSIDFNRVFTSLEHYANELEALKQ